MYSINSFIKKVEGNNGIVLINTITSKILDLNGLDAVRFNNIITNNGIEYDKNEVEFINYLVDNGWIVKVTNISYTEEHKYYDIKLEAHGLTEFRLSKILLELSTDCSLDCIFCDKDKNTSYTSCSCKRWNYERKNINYELIVKCIIDYEVEKIIIIGGDPFYNSFNILKVFLKLLKKANYTGEVVINTNCSYIDEEKITFLKNFPNVRINVIILGGNEEDYQNITRTSNTFGRVIKNIRLLIGNSIKISGSYILNDLNTNSLMNSILKSLDMYIGVKYVFNEEFTSSEILKNPSNRIISSDYSSYQILEETNCCLYSQIFIAADLKVYPCPYLREFLLGDLEHDYLYNIFQNEKYREFWFLAKGKINSCKLCKYKLQCLDCRAIEYEKTANLYTEYYCNVADSIEYNEVNTYDYKISS